MGSWNSAHVDDIGQLGDSGNSGDAVGHTKLSSSSCERWIEELVEELNGGVCGHEMGP